MNTNQPTNHSDNPLAGHPLLQKEKPTTFVVPANITDADFAAIEARLMAETKLPIEVVRAAIPAVAKAAPDVLRGHQDWIRSQRDRDITRMSQQLNAALEIIRTAKRPVKIGYIEQTLNAPIFRALEPALNRHPSVTRKTHKNQIYYTWKG